MPKSKEKP